MKLRLDDLDDLDDLDYLEGRDRNAPLLLVRGMPQFFSEWAGSDRSFGPQDLPQDTSSLAQVTPRLSL